MAGTAPLSIARVLWLLEWLPEGSAFTASQRGGPEHRPWTLPVVLGAAAVNAANGANWQRGGGSGRRPQPITPPKVRTVAGRKSAPRSSEQARAARRAAMRAARSAQGPHDEVPDARET